MTVKRMIEDLAFLGGKPAFDELLHVGRPNAVDRSRLFARFNEMLDRNWLTNNGPFVREFESRLAKQTGVKHCIAMSNGTIALEITTRGLGMSGEVIVPSFTFIATAHALQWQRVTPVFCDIDPHTMCIDPQKVEQMITPRTTGIIGVNLFGRMCAVDELTAIAKKHNLRLIFDSAHAFGCTYHGKPAGGFGDAEVLSFHATKFFNSGEGGAMLTNNDALAKKVRLMKNFGFAGHDNVVNIGTNGKMSEFSAAVGLTNLDSLDEVITCNRKNFYLYQKYLASIPGVHIPGYDEHEKSNFQYVVIQIDEQRAGISRDVLLQILQAENILARRYFYPGCHRMEPYKSYFPHAGLLLPETEKAAEQVLSLPTGTSVGEKEIKIICDIIRFVVMQSRNFDDQQIQKIHSKSKQRIEYNQQDQLKESLVSP